MKKFIYLLLTVSILFSCSENIKDIKLSELLKDGIDGKDNKSKLTEQLTPEEHELYSDGVKRLLFKEPKELKNMTVGDVIESQKLYIKETERQKLKRKKQIDSIKQLICNKKWRKELSNNIYHDYIFDKENKTFEELSIFGEKTQYNHEYSIILPDSIIIFEKEVDVKWKILKFDSSEIWIKEKINNDIVGTKDIIFKINILR